MTLRIRAYGLSDVGRTRATNEDSFVIDVELGLYLVADGMGGHGHGDVASRLAAKAIRAALREELESDVWEALLRRFSRAARVRRGPIVLERALARANEQLLMAVDKDPELTGMGTTVVAFMVDGAQATIAHVGDSRAYRLRAGRLEPLTHDHTWVAEQVTAGNLSEDQALVHPFKSVVTRALGGERGVTVEMMELSVAPGDVYLLCTDGLTGMVPDEQIHRRLASSRSLGALCNGLVADAIRGGGKDNITTVALAIDERQS